MVFLKAFLPSSNVAGSYAKSKGYRYDKLGNMTYQTGIGYYKYYADKPHAVKSAGSRSYTYDDVGNMTNRNGDTITYNPLSKPAILKNHKNGKEVRFYYGVGGARFMKSTADRDTFYIGKAYEEQVSGSEEKQICYISIGGKTIGTHTQVLNTDYVPTNSHYKETPYNRYFHTDALGSITAITDDAGKVVERRSYEPFGKIRAMDYELTANNAIIPANTVTQTARAFTGHEQIAELSGLIHMNARVYDSDIGRFLSADTIIQAPHDSQSYNRYSYVRNNPLMYTDPSGHSWLSKLWKKVKKWVRTIVSIVITVVIAVYMPGLLLSNVAGGNIFTAAALSATGATTLSAVGMMAVGAAAGFASTLVATGSISAALKGAMWGAISAGVAYGIGHGGGILAKIRDYGKIAKAAMHGLSRAVIAKFQTGSGKGGFLSGFASSLLGGTVMEKFGDSHIVVKVTMAAIAGGTASVLGGGKFANGAMAGAFIMMFNELMKPKIQGGITKELKDRAKYYTKDAKLKRGLAIQQELKTYSKPMMAAGSTGVAVVIGGEVVVVSRQWIMAHPNEITSFVQGYNAVNNYNPVGKNVYYHVGRATREVTDWIFR